MLADTELTIDAARAKLIGLAADRDHVVVDVDEDRLLAHDLDALGAAVELRERVVGARHPDEGRRAHRRVVGVHHLEGDDLASLAHLDEDAAVRLDDRSRLVARHELETEIGDRPLREEHASKHVDGDGLLLEDVGEREHGVARDGRRERGIRIDRDRHERLRAPRERVLDRVDEPVGSLRPGRHHAHEAPLDDLGVEGGVVGLDTHDREG